MFCEQCGKKLPDGARFCPICGTPAPKDDENIETQNGGTEEHVENVEEPIVEDKKVYDNFETPKKPKKHRKKSKAIIALCTAVVVVGASVGGFALYQNYEKKARVQKYYDIISAGDCDPKDGEHNYEKLSAKEKKDVDEMLSEDEVKRKNHYILYDIWDNSLWCDRYVESTLESGVLSDAVLNLPKNAYNHTEVNSYVISKGKIYGEIDLSDEDEHKVYKLEGDVNDPTEFLLAEVEREIECAKKSWKEGEDVIIEYAKQSKDYEAFWETHKETYLKAHEEGLKEFEKDGKKWIEKEENISSYRYDESKSNDKVKLFFKIKDIKDNTLFIEDCYIYNIPTPHYNNVIYYYNKVKDIKYNKE